MCFLEHNSTVSRGVSVVAGETLWPSKAKIFTLLLFAEKKYTFPSSQGDCGGGKATFPEMAHIISKYLALFRNNPVARTSWKYNIAVNPEGRKKQIFGEQLAGSAPGHQWDMSPTSMQWQQPWGATYMGFIESRNFKEDITKGSESQDGRQEKRQSDVHGSWERCFPEHTGDTTWGLLENWWEEEIFVGRRSTTTTAGGG